MTPHTAPRLLNRIAAAEALGISMRTLDEHIRAGRISAVRIGRLVRIPLAEVERVVREGVSAN